MTSKEFFTFKRPEIAALFSQARRIYKSRELDLLSSSKKKEFARLLIITPKKIGNAPQRNRIKRQLRAIFYENRLFELHNDLVAICKKDALDLSFDALKEIICSGASL